MKQPIGTLVDATTGRAVRQFKGFKDRLPRIPAGFVVVDDDIPKKKQYSPIYDLEAQAFIKPRRVGLVDPDGVVQNIVLENPNAGAPDVPVPEGWERFDDRDWPTTPAGEPIGNGFKRKGRRWSRPTPPQVEPPAGPRAEPTV